MKKRYDIVIAGGGPAGITALIWAHLMKLDAVLLEASPVVGGQVNKIFHKIPDAAGMMPVSGKDLVNRYKKHLLKLNLKPVLNLPVLKADYKNKIISTPDGGIAFKCLLISTGVTQKKLGVKGEEAFTEKGVTTSASRDSSKFIGKKGVVLGGGDGGFSNALIMSKSAEKVTLIHRSSKFRARQALIDEVKKTGNIEILTDHTVIEIKGGEKIESLAVKSLKDGRTFIFPADFLVVKAGFYPNSKPFKKGLILDENGYIKVDKFQKTSVDFVFAAGDVTDTPLPSIVTACGDAAKAMKQIQRMMNGSFS